MSRKTEIQVGLTVLVGVAVLLWGIAWLSTLAKVNIQRVWLVRFPTAGGLAVGNEAQVNGVRKGVVKSLRLVGDDVLAEIALSKDVELTRASRVVIRSVSMMGDKVVAVDYLREGGAWTTHDTIPGVYEKGLPEVLADVGHATGSIATIASQLDSLAAALNRRGGLAATVENFRRTSRELEAAVAENRVALRTTMANFAATSSTAKALVVDRQSELKSSLDHFAAAAENLDRLSVRLDSLRATLQSTSTKLDRGEGTLGRLVNDQKLYGELTASVRELRVLLADMKEHPRKYLKFSVF